MKTKLLTSIILAGCLATVSCEKSSEFPIPTASKEVDGWEVYDDPPKINADSAGKLKPGSSSPEAAVVHFFASKVRNDKAFQDVLPTADKRSRRLKSGLEEYEQWSFQSVAIKKRKFNTQDKVVITILMNIVVGDDQDSGEDEVTVEKIGGKWLVTEVPS